MNNLLKSFLGLPWAPRFLFALFALGYPLAMLGRYTKQFELYDWLALCPALVWKGEVWTLLTYAFLPLCIIDWAIGLFWIITLFSVLGRDWSGWQFLVYSAVTTLAGGLLLCVVQPGMGGAVTGNAALIFGLMVAWERFHGHERMIMVGLGEWSVRQIVIAAGVVSALVLFFTVGTLLTVCMLFGGAVGWLYLAVTARWALSHQGKVVLSERTARLEL